MLSPLRRAPLLLLGLGAVACSDELDMPTAAEEVPAVAFARRPNIGAPGPAETLSVALDSGAFAIWPYTGSDVSGTGTDPINLIFLGAADPREIRNLLMSVDGNRTAFGFPAAAPFDCRWSDTPSGTMQTAWSVEAGWMGSTIQLQCGDFGPVRFHIRLFRSALGRTLGAAHFEVLIPGTTTHQVLSWELAEQLVTIDMVRTGLLDSWNPVGSTDTVFAQPTYRTIPAIIFNGLPPELQALAAGVPGNAASDVGIPTNGAATIFNVVGHAAPAAATQRSFTLQFDQVIPKPFCNGPAAYLYVRGPVTLVEEARLSDGGRYVSSFTGRGKLRVIPIDPSSGQPDGAPYFAEVDEAHGSLLYDDRERITHRLMQILLPGNHPGTGRLLQTLEVDSRARRAIGATDVRCN